jgi:hypothetical protein
MELERFSNPDVVATAYVRGELRLAHAQIDETVPPEQIAGYADCVRDYRDMQERRDKAQIGLLDAMGNPTGKETYNRTTAYVSWHLGTVRAEEKDIPVAYCFRIETKDGIIGGSDGESTAMSVTSYTIHRPQVNYSGYETHAFTGEMTGLVLFAADASATHVKGDQVVMTPFDTLQKQIITKLRWEARLGALETWVDSFMDLPHYEESLNHFSSLLGMDNRIEQDQPMLRLFTQKPADRQDCLKMLARAFESQHFQAIYKMLDLPIAALNTRLVQMNSLAKLQWFVDHAMTIRKEMEIQIRNAVVFGFANEFNSLLTQEVPKIEEVESTVKALRQLKNINHCAPERVQSEKS